MSQRIIRHILFWFSFVTLYVIRDMLFAGSSDLAYPFGLRIMRFFFSELSLLPWKAIPFYVLFYVLIPRFFSQKQYIKTAGYFLLTLCVCLIGYRSMVAPVSQLMYNETPAFNVNKQMVKVFYDEILYVESLKDYAKIITRDQVIVTRGQIGEMEALLQAHVFLRIHRSYLVSLPAIKAYSATDITVGDQSLSIGRSYKELVSKALQSIFKSD